MGEEKGREEERKRKSKDKRIDGKGRKLIEFEKRGWKIFNENVEGDIEAKEFTYMGGREYR